MGARGHYSEVASLDPKEAEWHDDFPAVVHRLGKRTHGYGFSPQWVPLMKANHSRFDAVIINGIWQFHAWGTWFALSAATPYFIFPHGMLDPWFRQAHPLKHLKKSIYWALAERRVLRDARAVLFTSEDERLAARKSFWPYLCVERVVNYGTEWPVGDPKAQAILFRNKFPLSEGKRCLLFLGRIHPKKGPDILIEALNLVLQEMPDDIGRNIHLIMAGTSDGAYVRKLMILAEQYGLANRITWTGHISGDLKWGAFHTAEAFVLPSHQENFGIAVSEALACGTPVLISNRVNIWREIYADGAGLIANDSVHETRELLNRWIYMPEELRREMKVSATACFKKRFHIGQAAACLEGILKEPRA
jgi:glycosyltransferase involved in cell wall biosynthesis